MPTIRRPIPRRPIPMATWESVIECAEWQLDKAKGAGDQKRAAALRQSIRIARRMIKDGRPLVESK